MELLYYSDPAYLYIFIPIMLLSFLIQNKLKSKFKKFSQQTLSANLSGKEIAEKMLSDHGIYDVKVCLLYTSPSPRDRQKSRMPSSA